MVLKKKKKKNGRNNKNEMLVFSFDPILRKPQKTSKPLLQIFSFCIIKQPKNASKILD